MEFFQNKLLETILGFLKDAPVTSLYAETDTYLIKAGIFAKLLSLLDF